MSFSGHEKDVLFFNCGDGRFLELGSAAGIALTQDGRGVGAADLDRDGDLELVVHNAWERPVVVFRNELGGRSVTIQLHGHRSNRFGIGARVEACGQVQEMSCGGGFMSSNPPELHFGTRDDSTDITVYWPSETVSRAQRVRTGTIVTIDEDGAVDVRWCKENRVSTVPVKRLVRAGDSVPGWKPGEIVAVWNSACPSCASRAEVERLHPRYIETGFEGLVNPYEPEFPVVYRVGQDGVIDGKWVGPPPEGWMRRP